MLGHMPSGAVLAFREQHVLVMRVGQTARKLGCWFLLGVPPGKLLRDRGPLRRNGKLYFRILCGVLSLELQRMSGGKVQRRGKTERLHTVRSRTLPSSSGPRCLRKLRGGYSVSKHRGYSVRGVCSW